MRHIDIKQRSVRKSRFGMFKLAALILALTAISALPGHAFANGGDVVWQAADSQPGKQEANASVIDSRGNVIITGYQNIAGGTNDDMYTVKFKSDGSGVAWRAVTDQSGGEDRSLAVVVDANDDVIVTGYVWNGVNRDIRTTKYSGATGAVIWQDTYNGVANGGDIGTALAVDSLDNIYVAGNSQNAAGNDDIVILKYSPDGPENGSPLWQVFYNGPANGIDQVNSVTSGAGGIAITGKSWNGVAYDMLTVKYDFSGAKLWETRYSTGSGSSNSCIGNQVKIDASGNVVAAGSVSNGSNLDIYLAKYDASNGAVIWQKTYDSGFDEEPLGMSIDPGGDVFVTGYTFTLTGANDFYTARYDGGTGNDVWQQVYDSGDGNTDMAVATGIVVDPSGDVFVTGYTVSNGNYDFRTIKYKRDNGNLLWQQSYNGPANKNDRPVGIGLSPAGEVVIAGWSDTVSNDLDYLAIKYDPGLLNAPTNLAATTLSNSSIQLAWADNSSNEDGFKIERKLGDTGTYALVATVGANVTSYADTGLPPNNSYFYRVKAFNAANGDSHYSNEANALTVFVTFTAPAWNFIYNNADNTDDYANAVAVGPDNNPVVTGFSNRNTGTFDYFTVKLNHTDKSVLWSDQFDDADSEVDQAKCVAVDSNNNAIVSGFSQLFNASAQKNINSIYTIKYPAAGPPEAWHGQYNGPGAIDDRATAIATASDPSNNIVIIGYGKNSSNNDDIYVIKYSATPTLDAHGGAIPAWSAVPFDGGGDDIPSAVAIAPDGSVFVTGVGEKPGAPNIYNFYTAKYNGGTGALVWSDLYSVTANGDNHGNAIAVDGNGDVYVTGTATTAAGTDDIYTIKYSGSSSTPQRLWERAVDGAGHGDDEGIGVRVDPIDGAIVVAGTTLTAPGDHDMTVVRYTPAGDTVWQKTLLRNGLDDYATAMTMDSSGYVYLAGNTGTGVSSDIISLIYDSNGNLLGASSFNGAANDDDEASSIAVNYLGEAFIAGYSKNSTGNADYVMLKQVNNYILVPAPFTALSQTDSARMNLSWGNNTPGTTFLIDRTLGPAVPSSVWTLLATAGTGNTTYQDTGLNSNTSYCYRITAVNGSLSSRKIITCATTTPLPPVLAQLSLVSSTAIDLSWSNVSGNTGYKLERMTGSGLWAQIGGNLPANQTVYHDTGLTSGAVYSYRVSALSPSGASATSSVQAAPVLNAISSFTSARIDLSWPAVPGVTGYKLERSTDNVSWSQIAAPAAAAVSYSDTTVLSGTLYYYRLKAVSGAGDSVPSLAQSTKTKLATPAISSAAGVAGTTNQITVTWSDPNNNESGYTLEYAACNNDYPYCNPAYESYWGSWTSSALPANTTSLTIGSLTAGRAYRLRVTANLTGANSDPSAYVAATANLAGPVNLSVSPATSSTATLTWSDGLGETNYRVEQDGVILTGTGLPLGQNAVSYTAGNLSLNTQYCFRVQPYNATSSAFSNQSCVTLTVPPSLNSVAATSSTQINFAWTDSSGGGTGYEIWQSAATYQYSPPSSPTTGYWNNYTLAASPAAGSTSYSISTGLTAGYTYKFKIRYKLLDGSYSAFSTELMTTTVPPPPTPYAGSVGTTFFNIFWSNVNGETGYNLQFKPRTTANCSSEDWSATTPVPLSANATTYPVSSLTPGATYCFRLNAVNAAGTSNWGTAGTQTTLLPAPTLNAPAGVTQSQMTLSWNNVTGNTGYKLERSTDNISWLIINSPVTDIAAYTDTNLTPNQIYYYRVSTKNSANVFSTPSNVQSATTLPVTPPVLDAPTGVTISQLTLSWNDVGGNTGYKIERSADNSTWTVIASPAAGSTSYTNTGLSSGTLYYYRISTKNNVGGFSSPSNVQSATTTPAAPAAPSLTGVSEARIDLSWQVVYGATNYKIVRSIGSGGPWTEIANAPAAYATLYCGTDPAPSVGCQTRVPVYTSYSDTGLTENTQYCYQLKAWNATGGDSALSPSVCLKTPAVNGPALTAVTPINSLKIRLDWIFNPAACAPVACGAADGFEIWRLLPSGDWAQIDTVGNVLTYTDTTSIEPMKSYSYKIRAFTGSDRSPYSNTLTATTPSMTPNDSTCP